MPANQYQTTYRVVIPSGAATSPVYIAPQGKKLIGVRIGSAWTTASLTLLVDPVGDGTFTSVYLEDGTELTLTAAASKYIVINRPIRAFRIKPQSGVTGTTVNQASDRIIHFVFET